MKQKIDSGIGVLVHCHAGKSRSATICAAYLVATEGLSDEQSIDAVHASHPRADPNVNFREQLKTLHENRDSNWISTLQ